MKKLTGQAALDWCENNNQKEAEYSLLGSNRAKSATYSLGSNGEVNVKGDFYVEDEDEDLKEFPVQFGVVTGDFSCGGCTLLASLDGAPQEVMSHFDCDDCTSLISLEGGPQKVEEFNCNGCTSLTSLEGAPQEVADFSCNNCDSLTSLVGGPQKVMYGFSCIGCTSLASLEGGPQKVTVLNCEDCTSLTLKGITPGMLKKLDSCYGEVFDNIRNMNIKGIAQERYLEVMIRQLGL